METMKRRQKHPLFLFLREEKLLTLTLAYSSKSYSLLGDRPPSMRGQTVCEETVFDFIDVANSEIDER